MFVLTDVPQLGAHKQIHSKGKNPSTVAMFELV